MLAPLLLSMALSSATFHCAAHSYKTTPTLIASNGTRFTLLVNMDDDHGKNTHLCEADFTFLTDPPDQNAQPDQPYVSDDVWNRPIALYVYGFDAGDTRVFGIIREGASHASTTLFSYSLTSNDLLTADLSRALRGRLQQACIASVTVVGTTNRSEIVVASGHSSRCPGRSFALDFAQDSTQAYIVRSVRTLPADATVVPLDTGKRQP